MMIKKYFSLFLLGSVAFGNAQNTTVTIQQANPVCNIGDCTNLMANYTPITSTANYSVASRPYQNFMYSGGQEIAVVATGVNDDFWSPAVVELPFNFNFYGNNFNQLMIGTNGVISFDINGGPGTMLGGYCDWQITGSIPSPVFPSTAGPITSAVFGSFQDFDFWNRNRATSGINYYLLDTGIYAAPNRVMVINFNALPQYAASNSAAAGLQTSQIVLHETTNAIEVNVQHRKANTAWQTAATIGIQNHTGTLATAPPGRNSVNFTTDNESWLFTPIGNPLLVHVTWKDAFGNVVGNSATLNACAASATNEYTAVVDYTNADGTHTVIEENYNLQVGNFPQLDEPQNIVICSTGAASYTVDLTSNEAVALGTNNPQDYVFTYWTSFFEAAAGFGAGRIITPTAYVFDGTPQTIYMRIEDALGVGCQSIKPFQISVTQAAPTPVGSSLQYFSNGQTLNDLIVTGNNIVWYNAPTAGNMLPGTTLLQNNFTYYAESENANGCQGKMLAERLAVTVQSLLTAQSFDEASLKIYPNPVSNVLTISYPEKLEFMRIYNTVGQTVFAKNIGNTDVQADLSQLTAGVYFVNITSGNKSKTTKILKK